ncbi:hypothetical protein B0H16DRAFT_1423152 [Mycena metata]|uniref:Uncharacterized protein n=1 Tax=Mycena metata TaxID=1033252 RepID=A0AAD7IHC6_9AGAR|nr:hypothetical protein B0H16DRAFT_1423152 [Mycena metata]
MQVRRWHRRAAHSCCTDVLFTQIQVTIHPYVLLAGVVIISSILFGLAHHRRKTPLQTFYRQAWGRQWPRHHGTVTRADIGDLDEHDELYTERVDANMQDYTYSCLEKINIVANALSLPPEFNHPLVVREDYLAVLPLMKQHSSRRLFIITGQPGIGKTTFLIYLLLYRLERKLPTAIQLDTDQFFIFDDRGAVRYDATAYPDERLQKCWALCDSNDNMLQMSPRIRSSALRILLTTSPKPDRWKEMGKQLGGKVHIIKLPSVMEIAAILSKIQLDPGAALRLVGRWGPSLRSVIYALKDPQSLDELEANALNAAVVLSKEAISLSLSPSAQGMLPIGEGSSLMFLDRVGTKAHLSIPTRYLGQILDQRAHDLTNERAFELFSMLSSHSLTRSGAGWGHEIAVHRLMIKEGKTLALQHLAQQMNMPTTSNLLYGTIAALGRTHFKIPFYWMPSAANFPGIDSVLGDTQGNIFILQATIAQEHRDPKDGIRKIWAAMPDFRRRCTLHFVLVCEDESQADELLRLLIQDMQNFTVGNQKLAVNLWTCVFTT